MNPEGGMFMTRLYKIGVPAVAKVHLKPNETIKSQIQ
jgi:hypothetical protein